MICVPTSACYPEFRTPIESQERLASGYYKGFWRQTVQDRQIQSPNGCQNIGTPRRYEAEHTCGQETAGGGGCNPDLWMGSHEKVMLAVTS